MIITVTIENENGDEFDVQVEYSIQPAQNGGLTDPSWNAFYEIDGVYLNGENFDPSEEQQEIIDNEITEAD